MLSPDQGGGGGGMTHLWLWGIWPGPCTVASGYSPGLHQAIWWPATSKHNIIHTWHFYPPWQQQGSGQETDSPPYLINSASSSN